jgi:uncharacterized ferredoxin-like protein
MQATANHRARVGPLATDCAGCGVRVTVDVRSRMAEAADGSRCRITYADIDIAVWDCPACEHPNADELH